MRKTLEIVNDKIADLKDSYQHYTMCEEDKFKAFMLKKDIEDLELIKKDLELLEKLENNIKE